MGVKLPWPHIRDPQLASLTSAVRAAVVFPAVFAFASQVIGQPQTALFAAFGCYAMLALADFGGRPAVRLLAYLTLAIAGAVLVVLGTLCSHGVWLAAGAMAVTGFVILLAGVINGYFAAGGTAAILAFVLAVSVPAPLSVAGWRLAGWGLAAAAAIAAVMLIWPPRARATLCGEAAGACLVLADLADALATEPATVVARRARAQEAVDALRTRLAAAPHRLAGPVGPAAALAALIDELGWLCSSLTAMADSAPAELCRQQNAEALVAVAATLRDSASRMSGRRDLPGTGRLATAQAAVAATLARRIAQLPPAHDDQDLESLLGRAFQVHAIAHTTLQIAGYATAAGRRGGTAGPRDQPLAPARHPGAAGRLARARAAMNAVRAAPAGHASVRSVWFRNSLRGAAGLALAVLIAQRSGLQYSFWVVLGALSVLRSNALGTSRSVLGALTGTAAGIGVGAALLIPLGAHDAVPWALLPPAVLLAAYTPRAASFAVGQAAFTVALLVLFNIIDPAGWTVGLIRIQDVAVGCAVSLAVGLVFWPRGAGALLRGQLADAYARTAGYAMAAVEGLTGRSRPGDQDPAAAAATAAVHRLDDVYRAYLAERGGKRMDPESAARLVAGAARMLHAGRSLAALSWRAADGQDPRPCSQCLGEDAQALRSWYVTFSSSLARAAAIPAPQPHDPESHRRLLSCARTAIVSGRGHSALSALWAHQHLDALWRLESHLGRQPAREPARPPAGRTPVAGPYHRKEEPA
jgi:uncharacterized membrane protein YccC